nr:hypothetical protein [Tanacetum cinerariifolium]
QCNLLTSGIFFLLPVGTFFTGSGNSITSMQTPGSGISILLAVGTPSTGSGNLYCQWELSPSSGNALCILFPTGGHTAVYQFFVDMLKQMDREDLNQLWTLVKETLSIRQALSDKEKELWVELKRLYEPDFKDQL